LILEEAMKSYPLEGLLRPAYEWVAGILISFFVVLLFTHGELFLLSGYWRIYVTLFFILLALLRFKEGWRVIAYQRHLKQLSYYDIHSKRIPQPVNQLFIGKGFQWTAQHTQRLRDLKQVRFEKYLKKGRNFRSLPALGGNSAIHGVEPKEKNVYLTLTERVGHTLIAGTTRVGKTKLLELKLISDIRRNDSAVVVIDPKGDPDLLRRLCIEAKSQGRADDVIIFHLGYPDVSARYNPIGQFTRVTEVANRVANQLPSQGESATFREFAWRFVNIIANALVALGRRPNYKDLDRYILNIDPLLRDYCDRYLTKISPNWKKDVDSVEATIDEKILPFHLRSRSRWMIALMRVIHKLKIDDVVLEGLTSIFNYDQTYFQKITASLSPLFSKLTTGKAAELLSPNYKDPNDERPIFDWLQVIRGKKVVYIGLDALSDAMVASAVGNSLFADLCSTVGQIYKFGVGEDITNRDAEKSFYKVNVYADEFNELAGDEFIPLSNKGGGAGLQLTVATQTISDIEARLGNRAKANQILGNFNSFIFLRVIDEPTAKFFTDKLPQKVQSQSLVQASSTSDQITPSGQQQFSSQHEDRILVTETAMLTPDDLMQLPKGHAFCLLDGGNLWKMRVPLIKDDLNSISDSVETIIQMMRKS
jgi:conjugative coupling factor TraD (SXT/TOL subfamily)